LKGEGRKAVVEAGREGREGRRQWWIRERDGVGGYEKEEGGCNLQRFLGRGKVVV